MTGRSRRAVARDEVGPGQESVWDYPRPPRLEATGHHLLVALGSTVIADSTSAFRVLETSHPPSYYLPPDDCDLALLVPSGGGSFCEWKGSAVYRDLVVGSQTIRRSAWTYPDPTAPFAAIRDHLAFYPALLECFVDGEPVTPQPGGFYGGWMTSTVAGPVKGPPGTEYW